MDDGLTERVEALERAVTDGDHDLSALANDAEALDRLDRLEDACEELETRVAELEAATQALRGYVGNVRAVNEEVEARAETALAKVEALEEESVRTAPGPETGQASTQPTTDAECLSRPREGTHPRTNGSGSERQSRSEEHSTQETMEGGQGEARERTEGGHCTACGRAQSDHKGRRLDDDDGPTTDVGMHDEAWDRETTDSLGQRDPLVSDGDDEPSTLARFKQLL